MYFNLLTNFLSRAQVSQFDFRNIFEKKKSVIIIKPFFFKCEQKIIFCDHQQ